MNPSLRPTLAQLRLFLAVVHAGGFGEAAADLGMSQSSVSEGVASLERALDARLLRRGPAGATLTEAGARALEHAERAVQAAGDLLSAVQDTGNLSGLLRIASPRSAATHLLPPVLAAFRARHPGVRFQILDTDHMLASPSGSTFEAMLMSGQADIGILHQPVHGSLLTWTFYQDDYVLVVPEAYGSAGNAGNAGSTGTAGSAQATWSDITGHVLMLPSAGDTCNILVHSYLREYHQEVPPVIEVENDSVTLGMVAHGLGHAILPRLAVLPLPAGLRLMRLPTTLRRTLSVAVMPARASLPIIAAMTESLRRRTPGVDEGSDTPATALAAAPRPAGGLPDFSTL
ncbi:LysR family transcriptional regulator [Deinococcus altitudinis]|uniref:LysR family transcriptional regulator n=1 Tax=Deinococcus altitudinis TaxID=468914 RepID=UPI003891CE66